MKPFASVLQVLLGVVLALAVPLGVLFRTMQLLTPLTIPPVFYKEWHFSTSCAGCYAGSRSSAGASLCRFSAQMDLSVPHTKAFGISLFFFFVCGWHCASTGAANRSGQSGAFCFSFRFCFRQSVQAVFVALGIETRQHAASSPAFLFRNIVLTLWCCVEILMVF